MAYTNSPLVDYTKLSPNHSGLRNHAIDTITIHCVVGQVTVERLGEIFAPTSKQASCNYAIGKDGRIALIVEEKNRSWCSSSSSNDNRAVTIEVASDSTHPYAVNEKAYASLIKLCSDICKRNGIKKLLWKGDKSLIGQVAKQNMTVHRWFANKSCPGDYLYNRHGQIADAVNALLGAVENEPTEKPEASGSTAKKSVAEIAKEVLDGKWGNGSDRKTRLTQAGYNYDEVQAKVNEIVSGKTTATPAFKPYLVKKNCDVLNIRSGAGTNYSIVGKIDKNNDYKYTIVEEKAGKGSDKGWGKLKSGAGWIALDWVKKV